MTGQSDRPEWLESLQEAAKGPDRHFDPGESGQSDRIPRTDRDDPSLYDPEGMRRQCTFMVHARACRLDEGHTGLHSPGRAAAPPEPPLDVERLREKASALEALVREIAGAPVTIEIPHKYVEVQIDTRTWSEVGEWAGGAAPERLPSVEDIEGWLIEDYEAEKATAFGNSEKVRRPENFVAHRIRSRLASLYEEPTEATDE